MKPGRADRFHAPWTPFSQACRERRGVSVRRFVGFVGHPIPIWGHHPKYGAEFVVEQRLETIGPREIQNAEVLEVLNDEQPSAIGREGIWKLEARTGQLHLVRW